MQFHFRPDRRFDRPDGCAGRYGFGASLLPPDVARMAIHAACVIR